MTSRFPHVKKFGLAIVFLFITFQSQARPAMLPDFTELVEENGSAVVNISTVQKRKRNVLPNAHGGGPSPFGQQMPDILRHLFGDEQQQNDLESLGSGFIISSDGYILTNNHVVKNADEIVVRLSNRQEYTAQLVGADPRSDLALLHVDADNLPTVKIGSSSSLKVGEWVLAIGSPYGFDHSVTAGIVSAIGRSLPSDNYVPFIQTDVAINPGNSGGPLFNLQGEVVGINSQIYSRTGGFMGLSFAIPIDMAMESVEQLKQNGFVSRGWLGVIIQDINKNLAESFGLKKSAGALVASVLQDGPADDAGILPGDVITAFNDKPIIMASDLPHLVGRIKPGGSAQIEIVRERKRKTIKLTVGELPENNKASHHPVRGNHQLDKSQLGMRVDELSKGQLRQLSIHNGIVVTDIQPGPAEQAGIRRGDIIILVNYQKVISVRSFGKILKKIPAGKRVPVQVNRRGRPMFISIKLPD